MKKALLILFLPFSLLAQEPAERWEENQNIAGYSGSPFIVSVEMDDDGNTYVGGYIYNNSDSDVFTAKYDSDGNLEFYDTYDSGAGDDEGMKVGYDQSGNTYIVGNARNGGSLFVRKYNTAGTVQWTETYYGAIVATHMNDMKVRVSTGDVFITGRHSLATSGEGVNIGVFRYNTSGTLVWEKSFDGGSNLVDEGFLIELDDDGNVYVLGEVNAGTPSLLKYTYAGAFSWGKTPQVTGESSSSNAATLAIEGTNVAVYSWTDKKRYAISSGINNQNVSFENTINLASGRPYYWKLGNGYLRAVKSNTIKRFNNAGDETASISSGFTNRYIMDGNKVLYGMRTVATVPDSSEVLRYGITLNSITTDWSYRYGPSALNTFAISANNTFSIGYGNNNALNVHNACIPPEVELTLDSEDGGTGVCAGDTMFLEVDAEYADSYSWFGNGAGQNTDTIWVGLNFGTNYLIDLSVEVDAGNGCIVSEDFDQFTNYTGVEAYIVTNFEGDCESDPGVLYSLMDANNYEYNWYFNDVQQTFNASSDTMDLSLGNGTYVMEVYDTQTGCLSIPSPTYDVTGLMPSDDPSFSFAQTQYCGSDSDPTPTIDGLSGGTFSSDPAGLSIDANTGEIDLSASSPNPYVVQYKTNGDCPDSTTVFVQILNPDDAGFRFSSNTFCLTGTDPEAIVTGLSGGSFSGSFGLDIGLHGTIDLDASGIGEYDVTYLTDGNCPNSSEVTINITTAPEADHSYVGGSFCQADGTILPTFSGNGSAGAFSATPAGLSIDEVTGEVELGASTSGITYEVTNYIAAAGGCAAATSNSSVSILAEDDPTFSYSGGTFCLTGVDPSANITGTEGGTFTGSGGLVIHGVSGQIDLDASGVGPYQVTYTTDGNCPNVSVVNLNITTAPSADHSYSNSPYCADDGTATVSYGAGASSGVFSASPAGLVIDAGTGDVNLSTSTPNTYTVTNFIAASGGCAAASENSTIQIQTLDDASFTYSSSLYDVSEADPTPNLTGISGGVFSEPTGNIVFANVNTGELDLSACTVGGPYTIAYTTPGPCINVEIFVITITSITGLSEQSKRARLRVYPNPTRGLLSIESSIGFEIDEVSIYEVSGQRIIDFNSPTIDVSHLSSGIYLLSAKTPDGTLSWIRFIKE